jgi:hypothetical protein
MASDESQLTTIISNILLNGDAEGHISSGGLLSISLICPAQKYIKKKPPHRAA